MDRTLVFAWISIAATACGSGHLPLVGDEIADAGAAVDSDTIDAAALDADAFDMSGDAGLDVAFDALARLSERTLFIGNSFTFTNDLPDTYATLAKPTLDPFVSVYAIGGYTLTQHLADAHNPATALYPLLNAADAGATPRWSHVFLQEQSEIPGFGIGNPERDSSMTSVVALAQLAVATGAEPVLLMTWGYLHADTNNPTIYPDYTTMQGLLTSGYRAMAHAIVTAGYPVAIAPAGPAFQAVFAADTAAGRDPTAPGSIFNSLYGGDGIHPAPAGTYLAALVVTATLTGADPMTIAGNPAAVPAATQEVLLQAAKTAVDAERAIGGCGY